MCRSRHGVTGLLWLGFLLAVSSVAMCEANSNTPRPNIVFILTDDQDVTLFGQYPMNKTRKLIADEGMLFTNMFVTSPLCCPSRASILSGQYVHNHNSINNSISGGCGSLSWQYQTETKAFITYIKAQGYNTFFSGKYLNTYGSSDAGGIWHIPPGWDDWHALVGNSVYYNYSLSVNGKEEKHGDNYTEDYLTDVIKRRGIDFLDRQSASTPFFMMLSTPSCHNPNTAAPQYEGDFQDEQAPRTPHYNVHGKDKHWLVEQAITPMSENVIHASDEAYRKRHRTLLSVDDMIEDVYNKLKDMGLLDNTYIFFSSDNGFHLGQFSLPNDKRQLYEFDIRVPLMVRGPGIPPNTTSSEHVSLADLAPTFVDISGLSSIPEQFDGMSITPLLEATHDADEDPYHIDVVETGINSLHRDTRRNTTAGSVGGNGGNQTSVHRRRDSVGVGKDQFRTFLLIEHSGEHADSIANCPQYKDHGVAACSSHCVCEDSWNNTYSCVRYETSEEGYKLCRFQDNENFIEVYDLKGDPYELTNIAKSASPDLLSKLTGKLAELSVCKGKTCHDNSNL